MNYENWQMQKQLSIAGRPDTASNKFLHRADSDCEK